MLVLLVIIAQKTCRFHHHHRLYSTTNFCNAKFHLLPFATILKFQNGFFSGRFCIHFLHTCRTMYTMQICFPSISVSCSGRCFNGGACSSSLCSCPEGYYGNYCEIREFSSSIYLKKPSCENLYFLN